jgi:hypothetical protein
MLPFDPISAGLSVVGFGLQLFGMSEGMDAAKQSATIKKGIAEDEQKINEQKRQQMLLESSRKQMEVFRNMQRQRAMATAAAVNQGASSGSGLQGGLAGVSGQSLYNSLGISQNVELGQNIFSINNDISSKKMQLADVETQQSEAAGWASLGGSLMKAGPTFGSIGQNIFSGFGK